MNSNILIPTNYLNFYDVDNIDNDKCYYCNYSIQFYQNSYIIKHDEKKKVPNKILKQNVYVCYLCYHVNNIGVSKNKFYIILSNISQLDIIIKCREYYLINNEYPDIYNIDPDAKLIDITCFEFSHIIRYINIKKIVNTIYSKAKLFPKNNNKNLLYNPNFNIKKYILNNKEKKIYNIIFNIKENNTNNKILKTNDINKIIINFKNINKINIDNFINKLKF